MCRRSSSASWAGPGPSLQRITREGPPPSRSGRCEGDARGSESGSGRRGRRSRRRSGPGRARARSIRQGRAVDSDGRREAHGTPTLVSPSDDRASRADAVAPPGRPTVFAGTRVDRARFAGSAPGQAPCRCASLPARAAPVDATGGSSRGSRRSRRRLPGEARAMPGRTGADPCRRAMSGPRQRDRARPSGEHARWGARVRRDPPRRRGLRMGRPEGIRRHRRPGGASRCGRRGRDLRSSRARALRLSTCRTSSGCREQHLAFDRSGVEIAGSDQVRRERGGSSRRPRHPVVVMRVTVWQDLPNRQELPWRSC
ncbi:hypothetical protein Br6_04505 [Rhodococcus sp. Br-6]|nr:hypothetical protein Br6_04505 [Rhodococcus sp. Br-6]